MSPPDERMKLAILETRARTIVSRYTLDCSPIFSALFFFFFFFREAISIFFLSIFFEAIFVSSSLSSLKRYLFLLLLL